MSSIKELVLAHLSAGRDRVVHTKKWVETEKGDRVYCGWQTVCLPDQSHPREGERVIILANIVFAERGKGTFDDLLAAIQAQWPDAVVYAESVLNFRFMKALMVRGFREIPQSIPVSLYRRP